MAFNVSLGSSRARYVVLVVRRVPLIGFVAAMELWLMPLTAMGRDLDGRYVNSPLKPWFDQLKSRNGPCCSNADRLARGRALLLTQSGTAAAGGSRFFRFCWLAMHWDFGLLPPRRAAVAGSRAYRKWRGAAPLRGR